MASYFKGKLFVLTGAASGIGRATAKILAGHGALLSLSDINQVNLEAVKAELQEVAAAAAQGADSSSSSSSSQGPTTTARDPIFTAVLDVRSQEACDNWIRDTLAHFGGGGEHLKIAGAANLAGVSNPPGKTEPVPVRDVADAELDFVWDVNVRGIVNSLRAQLPHLREGRGGRGGGSVVNAGSISGLMGLPGYLPYVSSKHAVIGITRTAAKDEGPRSIRVNSIAPYVLFCPFPHLL